MLLCLSSSLLSPSPLVHSLEDPASGTGERTISQCNVRCGCCLNTRDSYLRDLLSSSLRHQKSSTKKVLSPVPPELSLEDRPHEVPVKEPFLVEDICSNITLWNQSSREHEGEGEDGSPQRNIWFHHVTPESALDDLAAVAAVNLAVLDEVWADPNLNPDWPLVGLLIKPHLTGQRIFGKMCQTLWWHYLFTTRKQFSVKHCTICLIKFAYYSLLKFNFAKCEFGFPTFFLFLVLSSSQRVGHHIKRICYQKDPPTATSS